MIRVMIVDDSPLVRKIAGDIISEEADMQVVATAATAEFALNKLTRVLPDVVTMDIEMPGIGGVEAIRRIMELRPTPVIVLSSYAEKGAEYTLKALDAGALDFLLKPQATLSGGLARVARDLKEKVRAAASVGSGPDGDAFERRGSAAAQEYRWRASLRGLLRRMAGTGLEIVGIGASTGGPVAVRKVLERLPSSFPAPILIVQHMPSVFTRAFAERLDGIVPLTVREAAKNDRLFPGRVLIAPGDRHLKVRRSRGGGEVVLDDGAPVSGHRPSVDVLMRSLAEEYGRRALGVIMTGMGKDGAAGIHRLHAAGGTIIAQDEASSTIFGMNREVIAAGDADAVIPLFRIAQTLTSVVSLASAPGAPERPQG